MSEAHACIERAKTLLASSDPASLRYACLELRMCMEAITYAKLAVYAERLPADVIYTWQPYQAVKALVELEGEEAGEEYTVRFRFGDAEAFECLGEHRTFDAKWLRKYWNAMSSFVHFRRDGGTPTKDYLEPVLRECERVAESSITSSLAPVVGFTCRACGRTSLANYASAERRGHVQCLHPDCEAELTVTPRDGGLSFRLAEVWFLCRRCGHHIVVEERHLRTDYEFACDACSRRYRVMGKDWRAEEVEPATDAE